MPTYTDLITRINRDAAAPNGRSYTTDELLAIIGDITFEEIVPRIEGNKEEHFLTYQDYTLAAATTRYKLPDRAIGTKARKISILDTAGNVVIESLQRMDVGSGQAVNGFYLEDAYIRPINIHNNYAGYTMRVYFLRQPGQPISTSSSTWTNYVTTITLANQGSGVIRIAADFSTAWPVGTKLDLIDHIEPGVIKSTDLTVLAVTTALGITTITFSTTVPWSDIVVGNYLAIAGYSPVTNITRVAVGMLAERVIAKIFGTRGLSEQKADAMGEYELKAGLYNGVAGDRTEGNPPTFQPRYNFLRRRFNRR